MYFHIHSRQIKRLLPALALAATMGSQAAAQVDLVADVIIAPGQVHVGNGNLVTVRIENDGTPLVGDYTAKIILSKDLIIDPLTDTVIHTIVGSFFGQQSPVVMIPWSMDEGQHIWGLYLEPAAGEVNLVNNWLVGTTVNVFKTDLQIDDPTPVEVFTRLDDAEAPSVLVTVSNIGTPASIVVFTIEPVAPAPWLVIETPSSFAVGGEPGNDVELRFDKTGLPPGSYSTKVRFANYSNPTDFEELDITLTIGLADFEPGQKVVGQVSLLDDQDDVAFFGVKGERVRFRVRTFSGDINPRLHIIDPDGATETILKFKHSESQTIKQVHKLKKSGEYTLSILGSGNTIGSYFIKTGRKLPLKARKRNLTIDNPGGLASVEVLILPHAILEFLVKPNSKFAGPLAVGFSTPTGAAFDVSANAVVGPAGEYVVEELILDDCGGFKIGVAGFGLNPKEAVDVYVLPFQPKPGKGRVYLK
ncbi:MAG: hypothetical protein HY812_15040 [Planctomycetes bacterium]|nr:hypothetical protein [Planctomycetota bacterium]